MSNNISIKLIISRTRKFFRNNKKDISILSSKKSLLITILSMIQSNYSFLVADIDILKMIINPLFNSLFTCAISILVIRNIVLSERLNQAITKTIFTEAAFKLMMYWLCLLSITLIIAKILNYIEVSANWNPVAPTISLSGIISFILYIRLITVRTDIVLNNAVRIKFNWKLTRNNFFKIIQLKIISLIPYSISVMVITASLYNSSIIDLSKGIYNNFPFLTHNIIKFVRHFFEVCCQIFITVIIAQLYVELVKRSQTISIIQKSI